MTMTSSPISSVRLLKKFGAMVLITACTCSTWAKTTSSSENYRTLATDIAERYTRSFPSENKVKEKPEKEEKIHEVRPPHLAEKVKREVVFNSIFSKSVNYTLQQQKMDSILNEYSWGDLKLFYGTSSTPSFHLMSRINRTQTILGEGALATMLVTPTSNIEELKNRQHIIQAFLDSPEEVTQLKSTLQNYRVVEESLLSFWTLSDPLYTKEYQKYMNSYFYSKSTKANKSANKLEFNKRFFRDFLGIQFRFIQNLIAPTFFSLFGSKDVGDTQVPLPSGSTMRYKNFMWYKSIPYYGAYLWWYADSSRYRNSNESIPSHLWIGPVAEQISYTVSYYSGISNYLEFSSVLRRLALRIVDVQALVRTLAQVHEQVHSSPVLKKIYNDRMQSIEMLLAQSRENTELGKLVHYLQTLPYQSWSYFFNNTGKLLASFKLFCEYKDTFSDAMYELGQLDAYISIATLMQEAKEAHFDHSYVFTEYLDRSQKDKPYINLEDMWNPFLDAQLAVGNSIEMDGSRGVRHIILTGPNAGGKSTFLTGVTSSLLLSQTFGIVPAKKAVITPFNKLNTYIDITDDIAAGKSLFMAEVDRSQKHLQILDCLQEDEFSFTIFDEPFSGTNPTEGAAAEYAILNSIANYNNTLNIVATHYPLIKLLEKRAPGKGFANYRVYITYEKGQKKIGYTYKIVPGRSDQNIAIDILEEQGYNTEVLREAREIVDHPEQYQE